ncbi:MAG: DUF4190 domain-containing protein [Bacteroidota bacterium]
MLQTLRYLPLLCLLLIFPDRASAVAVPVAPAGQQFERAAVEDRLGRKLKFKERIALSVVRGKLKRQQKHAVRRRSGGPTDGLAIASMVCGILGFFTVFTALPALVLGIVSLGRFRRDPQYRTGKGMAIAGIIMGGLVILSLLLIFSFVILFGLSG